MVPEFTLLEIDSYLWASSTSFSSYVAIIYRDDPMDYRTFPHTVNVLVNEGLLESHRVNGISPLIQTWDIGDYFTIQKGETWALRTITESAEMVLILELGSA